MQPLTKDDFAGREGTVFRTASGDVEIELVLETVGELPPSPRAGGAFRLVFRGPVDPILKQATYSLRHREQSYDIFIVPVGQDAAGTQYEAIFF
ncbi:MAG TPA: hypothetical protein VEB68_03290 [Croceibacterium sp.]|nr:hypothetical protein [Croceibacterium sp.]